MRLKSVVAAATIRIMKIAWVTYLGTLSRLNALLITRISAHPPILAQCKVHRPWALFCEGTVFVSMKVLFKDEKYTSKTIDILCSLLKDAELKENNQVRISHSTRVKLSQLLA